MPDISLTKPLIVSRILEKIAYPRSGEQNAMGDLKQALGSQMEQDGLLPPHSEWEPKKEPSTLRKFFLGHEEEPKKSTFKNPALAMTGLGGLYYGLHKAHAFMGEGQNIGGVDAFIMKRP